MAQWGPFLAVGAVVVLAVLVLAYRSQQTIDSLTGERDDQSGADDQSGVSPAVETTSQTPAGERTAGDGEMAGMSTPDDRPTEAEETEAPTEWRFDEDGQPTAQRDFQLTAGLMMLNVAFTQGLVVVVLAGAAWLFAIPLDAFGFAPASMVEHGRMAALGVAFGAVLWVGNELSTTLADAVGAAYDEQVRELLAPSTPGGWVALFGGVLPLIAVAEELLFRATLIGVPEAAGYGVSVWVLAVVASVAFALGHGAQGRVGVVVTGALGFVLAAGYVVSGSLLLVVVAHYVVNALEFLVHELLDLGGLESVL